MLTADKCKNKEAATPFETNSLGRKCNNKTKLSTQQLY